MSAATKKMTANEKPMELSIAVEGKIIQSNFDDFRAMAEERIGAISYDLKTDEDFDRATSDAKGLKDFETRLTEAKAEFLSQMDEVNRLLESVDGLGNLARSTRLELEKRVKARKTEVREGIIRDGIAALEVRNREFSDMIGEAIKGKSSLVKMQEAVTAVVEEINTRIEANRAIFAKASEEHGDAVAYGENAFLTLQNESAKVEIERRIERHRAALKEAELKAERDRMQREADERARQERLAEQARRETDRVAAQADEEAKMPTAEKTESTASAQPESIPPKSDMREENEAEEMETFLNILKASFAPAKEARAALKHPENIERAGAFAEALGAAFKALKSPKP